MGSQIVQFPDQLKQAFDQGHQICIHTWAHRALTSMTTAVVVTDLEWTLRAVQDVTGVRPNCIRPPYGDLDDRIRAIFRAMKLTVYLWNYDTEDWRLNTNPSAIDVVAIARSFAAGWNSRYPGVISLEHDYTVATASKGKGLVEAVKSQGMVPMSISQCLSGSSGGTPPSAFPPSTNGQCGPGPKTSCPDSTCCSQYGYCGITDAHCLIGCQPLYGRCAGVTVTTTTSSAATTTSSASPSSTVVPAWNDCVKGVSVCQSGYVCCVGKLDVATGKTTCRPTSDCAASPSSTTTASTQPSSSNIPVSTNGQCGSVTKTKCPGTNCCSQYGWCGTSGAHCGTGCQRLYGRCT